MKTTDAIKMITFLLVAITASGVVSGEKEVVLDSEGNPVKADKPYFVFHSSSEGKAFITRYNGHPQYLIREPFSLINPEPVLFSSDDKNNGPISVSFISPSDVVRVSTELHIMYNVPSTQVWGIETLWREKFVYVMESVSILFGAPTFTIQKLEGAYRFASGSADKPVTICTEMVGTISPLARLVLTNLTQVNSSCFPPVKFHPAWIRE